MGQQQLLLAILVTILVGIATIVAMNVFGTAAVDANRDAVRLDILQGATTAQTLYIRPVMMGGVGRDFTRVTEGELITRLGMPINHSTLSNENGTYSVTITDAHNIIIRGEPSSGGNAIAASLSWDNINRRWNIEMGDAVL